MQTMPSTTEHDGLMAVAAIWLHLRCACMVAPNVHSIHLQPLLQILVSLKMFCNQHWMVAAGLPFSDIYTERSSAFHQQGGSIAHPNGLNIFGQVGEVLQGCTEPLECERKRTNSRVCRSTA